MVAFTYTFLNPARRKTLHLQLTTTVITLLSLKSLLYVAVICRGTLSHTGATKVEENTKTKCAAEKIHRWHAQFRNTTRRNDGDTPSRGRRFPTDRRRRRRRFPCRFRTGHFHGHETQERQGERFGVDLPTYLAA